MAEFSDSKSLLDCFDIDSTIRTVALVGAGGKTSLMYALAREMVTRREKVVTTTTTKIMPPKTYESPCLILLEDDPELASLSGRLSEYGHVTVARSQDNASGKLLGTAEETLRRCLVFAHRVLIEADGASGRPIKAPETWEPVIPDFTDLVIPVVGLDSIGKPATEEWVFRLEKFLSVSGVNRGEKIAPRAVSRLLNHPQGALKNTPEKARVVPFLNKADLLESGDAWVGELKADLATANPRIQRLVIGKLKGGVEVRAVRLGGR